jgi:hypothetical protein
LEDSGEAQKIIYRHVIVASSRVQILLQTIILQIITTIFNMASKSLSQSLRRVFAASRPQLKVADSPWLTRPLTRSIHQGARIPTITSSQSRHRPTLQPHHQSARLAPSPGISGGSRTIFIQTEQTPNADVSSTILGLMKQANFPRPSNSSQTTQSFPKASARPSSNT